MLQHGTAMNAGGGQVRAGAATLGIVLSAQIAMQEAQRAIQYGGGALAGIGAEGLMETTPWYR